MRNECHLRYDHFATFTCRHDFHIIFVYWNMAINILWQRSDAKE